MSLPKQEKALVLSNQEVMPGTHLIWAEAAQCAAFARPGQFLMVRCDDSCQRLLRRPLSLHSLIPDAVAILFKVVGPGTRWLAQRRPGDKLELLGPLGNGFRVEPGWQNLLLVAGGLGIAPLAAVASQALVPGRQVTLLLGASQASYLYPTHLLPAGLKIALATEDDSAGQKGPVTDLISAYAAKADAIFACGPVSMYKTLSRLAPEILPGKPIQVSLETRMGCGLGGCLSCAIKTSAGMKRVCCDGPVFELRDIDWDWVTI